MKTIKAIVFLLLLTLNHVCFAQTFCIPVIPDSQSEINYKPEMFTSQMQWIADKKDSLNVPIVLHVGDVVDYNNTDHYIRASEGFKKLDSAGLSYAIALGNHDTDAVGEHSGSAAPGNTNVNVRNTPKFNSYFPVKRFPFQKGRFEKNKSDNAYYIFKAGGVKWLVVTLEFCARQASIDWAGKVISKYSKHNVIILTHYHLTSKGAICQNNAGYGDLSPQAVFDQLIKKYKNVLLVLSGHVGTSAWRVDTGEEGNSIYQLLQDYQGEDQGGGYLRLLEIDTKAGTIYAKMYSPFYNQTKTDVSQFSFSNVKFVGINSKK